MNRDAESQYVGFRGAQVANGGGGRMRERLRLTLLPLRERGKVGLRATLQLSFPCASGGRSGWGQLAILLACAESLRTVPCA